MAMNVSERITAFVDEGLGHASYLVDVGGGRALVIDPPRLPTAEIEAANTQGLVITWTADTHSHADYVSGSPELAAGGATFLASSAACLEVPHQAVNDGDEIAFDDRLVLRAIATPGHTPDHLAYLLVDDGEPVALFSGGSLMVGTVGRTDLLGPKPKEELSRRLFRALRERIMVLPDDLPVYPTHGAGSFCSAPGAAERTTTIGRERSTNALLAIDDEDTFVETLLTGLGSFPTYFSRLPELNRRGPHVYGTLPALPILGLEAFQVAVARGALVIDARPITAFSELHIPGALSIELRPVFASWLGWLVAPDRDLVFILDDDQDASELVRQCLDVGYERLTGTLADGMRAWTDAGLPVTSIPLIGPDSVFGIVVDVRQANEFATGHLPGAANVELGTIADAALPSDSLTMMCGHGERAMTAASILAARGVRDLRVLTGGPDEWAQATHVALERA
jgi:glyoxylase-like metal-dependent hydrolase (beta-lactamase superfamily II)/rhodanese-related sulfurtransferase